ncbi:hypothetical protein XH83_37405 (plasmid) [Bradyrhizobium sp. CCBAU 53351]|uniref:TIM-barrel domain-containing protein n=4 Tax=Bradyrhizobium TaxID=374 RepID=A0AAE5X9Y5_9BRAD|nr:hypothetical protein X265_38605 [Bradyrhizobium guangdongense]QAU51258.1 hypothetical protein XH91_37805 [Bradyrhizobium guangzhouense]QOZ49849.1 hypothetical protein XH89_38455 [Bradyrhizobium sp. CCBAU 53340]QOZ57298.1 hypothetical protein XH90_38900 [Bradyrhizobium sp. CCBAU 53338]QOZ81546.1 hypothetical protein XH83_37405 [Bradyrhizobium sp. CCBAU 53351]
MSSRSDTREGYCLAIYAPALGSLPEGSMLVMATLPVVDWNDCLLRDLRTFRKERSAGVYAAIVMIDPFACWEDLADALKEAGIKGIINFPPASLIERSTTGTPIESGQEIELRRLEWFANLDFRVLFATDDISKTAMAERRIGSHLAGLVQMPEEALKFVIGDGVDLVSAGKRGAPVAKFALLSGTKPPARK